MIKICSYQKFRENMREIGSYLEVRKREKIKNIDRIVNLIPKFLETYLFYKKYKVDNNIINYKGVNLRLNFDITKMELSIIVHH